jgi:aspartyl-tRNA(Asn)/glutamyl-tRNA(Gln) amidotransferase subunit B
MDYEIVIGLEVHAELSTKSKIYCSCENKFGLEVNTLCCPKCMGMPGTLPTLNEKVVEYAVKMGCALNCEINRVCKQDRKNYFYPDLPKAYQISQAETPICGEGYLDILVEGQEKRIGITRIHIEEDAGKLLHDEKFSGSLVDFNRCGVPLIEIVSEPDLRSPAEAKAYLETIKSILQYLGISDCKMQEGSIRCDVNVSVMKKGAKEYGTRCEMKNVNTFSGACRGIEYEAKRQIEALERNEKIIQETRRWDDLKGESIPLRSKEDAHDYRYFPEPDLLTIVLEQKFIDDIKQNIGELPNKKIGRYIKDYSLSQVDATLIVDDIDRAEFFEKTLEHYKGAPKNVVNWLLGDILKYLNETKKEINDLVITPKKLAQVIKKVDANEISNASAKIIVEILISQDRDLDEIIAEKNLAQISDTSSLEKIVDDVLTANPKSVEDYNNGKTNALGFLVGQCMKLSKGQGNPAIMKDLLLKKI